jgi:hypothetical protein
VDAALGVIAGFFLGVAADIVRQWLARKTRQEERSEKAAQDLIPLLDAARAPFLDAYQRDGDVDRQEVRDSVAMLRQKALMLTSDPARVRIELIAEVLQDFYGAQESTGDSPSRIAWVAWADGRETLRALLAREPIKPPSQELKAYKDSIEDKRTLWEEHMRDEVERRRKESKTSTDGGEPSGT